MSDVQQTFSEFKEVKIKDFLPSRNGFKFVNRFPGIPLPDALKKFIDTSKSVHGLCGGMCFTVIDHYNVQRSLPDVSSAPADETPLYRYLAQRQLDSWGVLSSQVLRYIHWMGLSDKKAQRENIETWDELRDRLDAGHLTVIGLIYNDFTESLRVWDNHQVLAHGYMIKPDSTIRINVYDPNRPDNDQIYIEAQPVEIKKKKKKNVKKKTKKTKKSNKGLTCAQYDGSTKLKDVHGFIVVPYEPANLPADLA